MDMREQGRAILAKQLFSTLLGIEFVDGREGGVELRLPIRVDLTQHYGSVHGGVVASLADTALTFAGGSVLGVQPLTRQVSRHHAACIPLRIRR